MENIRKHKAVIVKWIKIWIAVILVWSSAGPAVISAKTASPGSWRGGTVGQLAGGESFSLALKSDGTVVAWGSQFVPAGLSGVVSIVAGDRHVMALKSDGTVAAWGGNDWGQTSIPSGLGGVIDISAGGYNSLALKADGTVVAWGGNESGQANVPDGLSGVVDIAAGPHSLALKSDGTVVAWGNDGYGQANVPAAASTGVVTIAAGIYHSLALKSDGTVVAWGDNDYGQTGGAAGLTGVVAIAAGAYHSLALKSDGTVVAWGDTYYGQTSVPAELTGVVAIAAGRNHSLAIKSDGTVVAWGRSDYGQTNVPAGLAAPVRAKSIAASRFNSAALRSDGVVVSWGYNAYNQTNVPAEATGVAAIAAGERHMLALKADGTIVSWGSDSSGQKSGAAGLTGVVAIAAGAFHSLALKSDGTVLAWGLNNSGQANAPAAADIVAIAAGETHSLALKSSGAVVAWGDYLNDTTNVPAAALTGVVAIAAGFSHSLALKSDGTVVGWGNDYWGQTSGTAGLTSVVAIAEGASHSLALKADGTVVAWGRNDEGQTDVPAGLTSVVAIAAGEDHSVALKADGTVVTWGDDAYNQSSVPGSAYLNGLTLQEGALSPSFTSSVTDYTYSYVGPSTSSVHVTATVAIPSSSLLYINNQLQTSGNEVEVSVSGASTVIPIRVEPNLLPSKAYRITVLRDSTSPEVHFSVNGNASSSKSASTVVTVSDMESGVDAHSLEYAWTNGWMETVDVPADEWAAFTSGTLTKAGVDGNWYLHIRARDNAGNTVGIVSNPFLLDNTGPSVNVTMTKADSDLYMDDSWTNQNVTIFAAVTDTNSSVTAVTYSLDSGATWNGYTAPIVLQEESVHSVSIMAVDSSGNETAEHRIVKISKSGLKLTPTLTKDDNSAYTSGEWTNGSVTVSVQAEAGASGIAALTYVLDGGAEQVYTDGVSMPFDLEGMHTIMFKVSDMAGNHLTAPLAVNLDLTAPVITLIGSSNLELTAGDAYVEEGAAAMDIGGSDVADAVSVSGTVNTNVPGTYTLRYNVFDQAGNTAEEVIRTIVVAAKASPPSSDGDFVPAVTKPVIDLNGMPLDSADIDISKPSVTLEVQPKNGAVYVRIPASILASFEGKNAAFFIEIKTPYGSYRVPVNLASFIPRLEEWLARFHLKAEDISFKITLTDKSDDKALQAAFADGLPNGKVLGAMVDYHIDVLNAKTGQSIGTADAFSQALTRVIPMPGNLAAMPEQWGAFRYNETVKAFEFVPAKAVRIDGLWYVSINSYSNSAYVVADNAVSFADVQRHWSQSFVERAAAKGLVAGVGGGRYSPGKAVTRAEFTAMLVRALGRSASTVSNTTASYSDVGAGIWYSSAVAEAKKLGLLDFAGGSSFKPDQPLTREEMARMLAAVIRLENPTIAQGTASLDGYKDIGSVDAAYLESIRLIVKLQIMTGTGENTFSPKGVTTRAQAAVVFIRTLQVLGSID